MNDVQIKTCFEKYQVYDKKRRAIQLKIDAIDDRLTALPGSVVKMPDNPKDHQSVTIGRITRKIELERIRKEYDEAIDLVLDVRIKCPKYARLITEKYIERKTSFYLQDKYGYSDRQLRRLVDRCIEEYLEKIKVENASEN